MKMTNPASKWHYFNSADGRCHANAFGRKIKMCYCNRNVEDIKRHTEFKDQVTCLRCLRVINKENNL